MHSAILALGLVFVLVGASFPCYADEPEDMYVEGYVFHYGGRKSIRDVEVLLVAREGLFWEVLDSTTTDTNGFYQLRVQDPLGSAYDELVVNTKCYLRDSEQTFHGTLGTGISANPVREGVILRRDIFFDRTWRSLFKRFGCGQPASPDEIRVTPTGPPAKHPG